MTNHITVSAAAERLGLCRQRVDALIRAGRLPVSWIGPLRLIRESDLSMIADRPAGRPKTAGKQGPKRVRKNLEKSGK